MSPLKTSPVRTSSVKTSPVRTSSVKTSTVKTSTVKTNAIQPRFAQSGSVTQSRATAEGRILVKKIGASSVTRPVTGRVAARHSGTRCSAPVTSSPVLALRYQRRRAWVSAVFAGVLTGCVAVSVYFVGLGLESQVATPTQTGIEQVRVQQGDSMWSIAQQIAPNIPSESVIKDIMALNNLNEPTVIRGQSLLTPVYSQS